jgi:hypothetical protein
MAERSLHSDDSLPVFVLLIGAKMEPHKIAQICLPRFASNRHGFEFRIEVAISWLQSLNKLVSPIPNVVRFNQEVRVEDRSGIMGFLWGASVRTFLPFSFLGFQTNRVGAPPVPTSRAAAAPPELLGHPLLVLSWHGPAPARRCD